MGKGIQHDKISSEEQHMLNKLAKQTGVWNIKCMCKLQVSRDSDSRASPVQSLLTPWEHKSSAPLKGQLSTAAAFRAAPALDCLDLN